MNPEVLKEAIEFSNKYVLKMEFESNNHKTLRLMLCHGGFSDEYEYKLQTLKDNVSHFTPEILDQIKNIAVEYGHDLFFATSDTKELKVSCDSFVTETDVYFLTDINLLLDSLRKVITLIMSLCISLGITATAIKRDSLNRFMRVFCHVSLKKTDIPEQPYYTGCPGLCS